MEYLVGGNGVTYEPRKMKRKEFVQVLNMIEPRLEEAELLENERGTHPTNVLSVRGRISYLCSRGDSYYGLLTKFPNNSKTTIDAKMEFIDRCINSYTQAIDMAIDENISIFDIFRLQPIYAKARALWCLKDDKMNAKILVKQAYDAATLHTNSAFLEVSVIKILQKIRDEFLWYNERLDEPDGKNENVENGDPSEDGGSKDGDEDGGGSKAGSLEVGDLEKLPRTDAGFNTGEHRNGSDFLRPLSPYALAFVTKLRKQTASITKINMVELPYARAYTKGLTAIFRAYIRGNALPGQQILDGVNVGGSKTSFDKFLLHGPYLSWKGFAGVLKDFFIAKKPPKRTLMGSRFPQHLWDNAHPLSNEAPLSMEVATVLFVESSRTGRPVLMIKKFEKRYKELQDQQIMDPWMESGYWVDSQDWAVPGGLNFGQFCDCMAKIGSVIFSSRQFREALPEFQDRMDHFFQTSLKLQEESYWEPKVRARINRGNNIITIQKE